MQKTLTHHYLKEGAHLKPGDFVRFLCPGCEITITTFIQENNLWPILYCDKCQYDMDPIFFRVVKDSKA